MRVRAATPDDASAVRDLARVVWHAAYDDLLGPEAVDERVDDWYAVDRLRASMADEDDVFLVAEAEGSGAGETDGEVVGYCHAFAGEDALELGRLYVHPDRWGEGVGTALLERVLAALPESATRLRLVVLAGNDRGRGFYESRGFRPVERREGDLAPEVVYERALG